MIEIIIPEEEELTVDQLKEKREYHKKEIEKTIFTHLEK